MVMKRSTFLLIHGAWHGAWCYGKVIPFLSKAGHMAVAIDLPGYGLEAGFPKSYFHRPLDPAVFATESSPLAAVTLQACADKIIGTIEGLMEGGSGPVVLVGHSMGGVPITLVGEMVPEKIKKLVYLAAFMPEPDVPAGAYINAPKNQGEIVSSLIKADPAAVGAIRLDPRSSDPDYRSALKQAFYEDVSDAELDGVLNFLTPDQPALIPGTPIKTTQARWGSIKRAYIKCSRDNAIRPLMQQHFIDKADAFVPQNRTEVVTLQTSHSPFLADPEGLAKILIRLGEQ
jgi:pimeloyl-ACP methyl ester carboxylesterase